MMQGDQYRLPIELKDADGTFVTREEVKDLEIFVGTTRKVLSKGEVEFESFENVFYVSLSQKETFMMRGDVSVQARVLFLSGDVVGIDLGKINFAQATSKVVLK
jgi:hypothetical protein